MKHGSIQTAAYRQTIDIDVAKLIDIELLWDAFCHMGDYDGFV